jgi:hypothetical protein
MFLASIVRLLANIVFLPDSSVMLLTNWRLLADGRTIWLDSDIKTKSRPLEFGYSHENKKKDSNILPK